MPVSHYKSQTILLADPKKPLTDRFHHDQDTNNSETLFQSVWQSISAIWVFHNSSLIGDSPMKQGGGVFNCPLCHFLLTERTGCTYSCNPHVDFFTSLSLNLSRDFFHTNAMLFNGLFSFLQRVINKNIPTKCLVMNQLLNKSIIEDVMFRV